MEHPAEKYNKIKNITIAILHRDGVDAAYKYIEGQRGELGRAWYGLKAELDFYTKYQGQFKLTPSLDYGIKCDFTGMMDNEMCRIDVTTNYDYKRLSTFEPLMNRDGICYKLALMNKATGLLEDVFDLRFPPDNYDGKLFDIALFMPMEYRNGEPRYNYYQRILTISSTTRKVVEEKEIVTDWCLPDIHTMTADIYEAYSDYEGDDDIEKKELHDYLAESAKCLSKSTDLNIVACGQMNREIINPKTCETEEITRIHWKHPVIQDLLDDVIFDEFDE